MSRKKTAKIDRWGRFLKGSYALLMCLKNHKKIDVGSLGPISFSKGYYLYIGSAMNGVEGRVKRHIRDRKKLHWHVDYFLNKAKISSIYFQESQERLECSLAKTFSKKFEVIPKFGSSDCFCESHLFFGNRDELIDCVSENGMKEFIL